MPYDDEFIDCKSHKVYPQLCITHYEEDGKDHQLLKCNIGLQEALAQARQEGTIEFAKELLKKTAHLSNSGQIGIVLETELRTRAGGEIEDGDYTLENCRWATSKEQRANQRRKDNERRRYFKAN